MTRPRHPGVLPMVLGAACIVALLAAYVVTGRLATNPTVQGWGGTVTIDAPTELDAGEGATVVVTAGATDGTLVQLGVFAPIDSILLTEPLSQGTATFVVDPETMRHSGLYRLVAKIDRGESDVHAVVVTPLTAVDPVVPLVGPRTIIADGADITMTVVTPMDEFGNPVADGTAVDIDVLRPSGENAVVTELIDRALAAIVIEATTETGRVTISASADGVDGPSNVVDQVAGVPSPFTIEIDDRNARADGFALHQIETSELFDRFGNLLPDGVSAVFIVEDSSGISFLQAVVQGGIARTMLEAPNLAGTTTLTARIGGVESAPATIDFGPAVASLPATSVVDDDQIIVSIGPVVSERGGHVPDGTTASIHDGATGDTIAIVALRGGIAEIALDAADVADIEVEVLGSRVMVEES